MKNKHYQTFNNIQGGHDAKKELEKIKLPESLNGLTLLDVGCAEGYYCFEAARRGCARIVGIDIKPDRIEIAKSIRNKKNLTNVWFFNTDLYDIPDTLSKFDIVLCLSVFHHLEAPIKALKILRDMTKQLFIAEIQVSKTDNIQIGSNNFVFPPKKWVMDSLKYVGWDRIYEIGVGKNKDRIVFHCVK